MENSDYYTDKELAETLMQACQREADLAEEGSFAKEYWNDAIRKWKEILTTMEW